MNQSQMRFCKLRVSRTTFNRTAITDLWCKNIAWPNQACHGGDDQNSYDGAHDNDDDNSNNDNDNHDERDDDDNHDDDDPS